METTIRERLAHAWNAFRNRDPVSQFRSWEQVSYGTRPDRVKMSFGNEKSIIAAVYNRLAIDIAAIAIQHARLDENGRFLKVEDSPLNYCLTVEANIDQTGRAMMQDAVMSMFDEGCVAVVPTDTSFDPSNSDRYDILSLRVAQIVEWYPSSIKVRIYNERTGQKEEIVLPKKMVAIVENPLYAVMNEPNSTLKRLIYKLNLLDSIDQQSGSGKLDLIIQLPYVIKTEARREQAEKRRQDIEMQLSGSRYGIAYTDGTEKVTQLNRPVENNLMKQIEYLTSMLYGQLGMTQAIFDGTADEKTMLNYYNRSIEPCLAAFSDEFKRKFLTKTARSQRQTIMTFRDPFKLVPVSQIADIADKFTRNEILSSNEIRAIVGYKPDKSPEADELRNKNLNQPDVKAQEPIVKQKEVKKDEV